MAQAPQTPNPNTPPPPKPVSEQVAGGINLLPEVAEKEIKSGVYKRKVNLVALGILVLVGVAIVGILVFQGILALQANSIKNQTAEAEDRILENQEVEIKARATKEKLDKAEELLKKAIPSSDFVAQISKSAATTEPIKVTSLDIAESGEALVGGTAVNSEVFKQWVANLTSSDSKKYFDKINTVSLTGNPTEGYLFSFKMSFLEKGVYK